MVTFDVPREIYSITCLWTGRLSVRLLNHLIVFSQFLQSTLIGIVLWFLLDNSDIKCDLIAFFCVTMVRKTYIRRQLWAKHRQLWANNTLEIIVSGYALDQLSHGCYMPITASYQGYILFLYQYKIMDYIKLYHCIIVCGVIIQLFFLTFSSLKHNR